jgi:inhibitor of cysteine peptidase
MRNAASNLLRSLGPEVYANPENSDLVGGAGPVNLALPRHRQRRGASAIGLSPPWEAEATPERTFDCALKAR